MTPSERVRTAERGIVIFLFGVSIAVLCAVISIISWVVDSSFLFTISLSTTGLAALFALGGFICARYPDKL